MKTPFIIYFYSQVWSVKQEMTNIQIFLDAWSGQVQCPPWSRSVGFHAVTIACWLIGPGSVPVNQAVDQPKADGDPL